VGKNERAVVVGSYNEETDGGITPREGVRRFLQDSMPYSGY
jgi:hypothetical protein